MAVAPAPEQPGDTALIEAVVEQARQQGLGASDMLRLEALRWEFLARAAPEDYPRFERYAAAVLWRHRNTPLTPPPPGSAAPAGPASHAELPQPAVPANDGRLVALGTGLGDWFGRHRRAVSIAAAAAVLAGVAGYALYLRFFDKEAPPPPPTESSAPIELVTTAPPPLVADPTITHPFAPDLLWWLLTAAILLATIAFFLWRHVHHLRLRRDANANSQPVESIAVAIGRNTLFADPGLKGALRDLRRHRAGASQRIDVSRSIRATLRAGGMPSVRYGFRPLTPEYLVVSEREAPGDHLPEIAEALCARLDKASIVNARYEFYGDPAELREAARGDNDTFEPLEAVVGRHDGATMMLVMESADALPPLRANPAWFDAACTATTPLLFNPRAPGQWNENERALATLGLASFPASAEGLSRLAERIGRGETESELSESRQGATREPEPDLAAYLARHRKMLLAPSAPDPQRVAAVIDNLERWLDAGAMDWLRTIALFPLIAPGFTFFAGATLYEQSLVTQERFLALARLPWLRTGQMPDWMRKALVAGFSPARLERAAQVVQAYLTPPRGDLGLRTDLLRLRKDADDPRARRKLLARLRAMDNPLSEDGLLLGALNGQAPEELEIELTSGSVPQAPWHRQPSVHAVAAMAAALLVLNVTHSAFPPQEGGPDPAATGTGDATEPAVEPTADAATEAAGLATDTASAAEAAAAGNGADAAVDTPLLFIQVRDAAGLKQAQALRRQLAGFPIGGKGLVVAPIQTLKTGPAQTQLRCFMKETCAQAVALGSRVAQAGVNARIVKFRAGDFTWGGTRQPSQFELWIASASANGGSGAGSKAAAPSKASYPKVSPPTTPKAGSVPRAQLPADTMPQVQQGPPQQESVQPRQTTETILVHCEPPATSDYRTDVHTALKAFAGASQGRILESFIIRGGTTRADNAAGERYLASLTTWGGEVLQPKARILLAGGAPSPAGDVMAACHDYLVRSLRSDFAGATIRDLGGSGIPTRTGRAYEVTATFREAYAKQ